MRKEVFESGHVHRDRGARRFTQEGTDSERSSLSTFMHSTARDKFLPLLGADCQAMNAQVVHPSLYRERCCDRLHAFMDSLPQ